MKPESKMVALERTDRYGKLRLMAVAEGYVMARRVRGAPFVTTIDEWNNIDANSRVVPLRAVAGGDDAA